jgi:hypothetical protein
MRVHNGAGVSCWLSFEIRGVLAPSARIPFLFAQLNALLLLLTRYQHHATHSRYVLCQQTPEGVSSRELGRDGADSSNVLRVGLVRNQLQSTACRHRYCYYHHHCCHHHHHHNNNHAQVPPQSSFPPDAGQEQVRADGLAHCPTVTSPAARFVFKCRLDDPHIFSLVSTSPSTVDKHIVNRSVHTIQRNNRKVL